jgi:hypothetical protein
MKAQPIESGENNTIAPNVIVGYAIYCPGCERNHFINTDLRFSPIAWAFNGDVEKPTFSPSLLCQADVPNERCHSFITDGKIKFLSDCFHDLRGQTVELIDVE